tara:strand:- start:1124 stop:1633 length:510 start_codon:yes stop_codon:yes gene_type:complete
MSQITNYKGIKKIYFEKIIFEIIKIAKLDINQKIILDYGCGEKYLYKVLKKKILNFDKNPKYTEIENIDNQKFDIIVMNHVLMYFSKDEINNFFDKIYKKNSKCEFVIGIGKQNIISKLAKNLTFNFNAHKGTKTTYIEQIKCIEDKMNIISSKKNIFYMTDIFYTKFK